MNLQFLRLYFFGWPSKKWDRISQHAVLLFPSLQALNRDRMKRKKDTQMGDDGEMIRVGVERSVAWGDGEVGSNCMSLLCISGYVRVQEHLSSTAHFSYQKKQSAFFFSDAEFLQQVLNIREENKIICSALPLHCIIKPR